MRWLLHCNTGSLKRYKPHVPCFILGSTNCVIIKACSMNITGSTNLAYTEKVNLKVPVWLSLRGFPSFLGKEKLAKCTYYVRGPCFIHPPLIFVIQSLILLLQHIKFAFA